MYTQVLKRPSVQVKNRRCDSTLPEVRTATNITTWNVRTLNKETDFKLQNVLSKTERLKPEILGTTATHWTNKASEAFEYNDFVIVHSSINDNMHRQGVAIVLTKETTNQKQGYHFIIICISNIFSGLFLW